MLLVKMAGVHELEPKEFFCKRLVSETAKIIIASVFKGGQISFKVLFCLQHQSVMLGGWVKLRERLGGAHVGKAC